MLRIDDHRAHLAALRAAALQAVDPYAAVRRYFSADDVAQAERVFIVGAGKAGVAMAHAAAEIAGDKLAGGVISVPQIPSQTAHRLTFIAGGHPLPTKGSLAAGRAMAELLTQTTEHDLVVALISGGGSALLELLKPGLTLLDLQSLNQQLLKCGATVHEINLIRKRLSQIKGGGLLRLAHPARVLGLILSDVVGNPLDIIASGPTVSSEAADRADTLAIVDKHHLRAGLPMSVLAYLTAPLPPSAFGLPPCENRLIASNRRAGEAAARAARALGFDAHYLADDWQGEAREVGRRFAELLASPPLPPLPTEPLVGRGGRGRGWGVRALIVGGESTVAVRGAGRGGRNQEVALSAVLSIAGQPHLVVAAFATDGVDGPTKAAGAIVTGETVARARALGLDPRAYLENNDAHTFFAALGDLVITGPTGTNVNDLTFGLVYAQT